MNRYDEKLRELQKLLSRRREIEARAQELDAEEKMLGLKESELARAAADKRAALEKLEGRTAAAFFAALSGKKGERLEAARLALSEADAGHEAVARELAALRSKRREAELELDRVRSAGQRYDATIEEKAAAIRAAGGIQAQTLDESDKRIETAAARRRELDEAVAAGQKALNTTNDILKDLDSARSWSTVDILGGGLISDLAKHDRLDGAQQRLDCLRSELYAFRRELGDVDIEGDLRLDIDGFLKYADFFFDGLLADLAVRDRIEQSQQEMSGVKSRIAELLCRLEAEQRDVGSELRRERAARQRLIENATL